MTAPVRFATVGVLQNGLNVAVFALATAVGVQCRVAAGASAIDWHWEMPAVTLPALVMAGALIAASEYSGDAASREAS